MKKPSPKMRPDVNETAYRVMLESTGRAPKTRPGRGPKNPDAVARGSKGGLKGGKARAAKMTPDQRKQSARKAASKRWANEPDA